MSDPGEDDDYYDMLNDEQDDEEEFDCHLGPDGQCGAAGSEDCDWNCPYRDSELFAGSKAWMKAYGSACHACGTELPDGEEPGHPRNCANCPAHIPTI